LLAGADSGDVPGNVRGEYPDTVPAPLLQFTIFRVRSKYLDIHVGPNYISIAFDSNEYSLGVFLDLSNAFDKLLLKKLELYGIRGIPLFLFENNLGLLSRQQQVRCNGKLSNFRTVEHGVPNDQF